MVRFAAHFKSAWHGGELKPSITPHRARVACKPKEDSPIDQTRPRPHMQTCARWTIPDFFEKHKSVVME
ncbi:MAG: hypothetical protein EBY32_15975 [Proteobacteria bacterium]|nr:hypothetical protein [Pseudomonadota bacterium]